MTRLVTVALLAARLAAAEQHVYAEPGGKPLVFQHARAAGEGLHPAVILVGDRSEPGDVIRAAGLLMVRAGLDAILVTRRGALPGAAKDVEAAARFLARNAENLGVDPQSIALAGYGRGAFLANLVASRRGAGFRGVVSIAGWSDLRQQPFTESLRELLEQPIAEHGEERTAAEWSPALRIAANAPPFLLIHGDRDRDVPVEQAAHWQGVLLSRGVPCALILIENGGHDPRLWAGEAPPRDWTGEMIAWLRAVLKK